MSMDVGGAKGGVKSDINVTPLVDVMLVLLIIMMLIAPLLQQGVKMTLPMATNTTDKPDTQEQTVVYIDAMGKLYINQIEVSSADVGSRVATIMEDKTDRTVYLKGDTDAPYSAVMQMMEALRKAGIDTVGLITERPGASAAAVGGN